MFVGIFSGVFFGWVLGFLKRLKGRNVKIKVFCLLFVSICMLYGCDAIGKFLYSELHGAGYLGALSLGTFSMAIWKSHTTGRRIDNILL